MNENKLITGIVKEKTIDSIKIENSWIKFFKKEMIEDVAVGDKVEVTYKDNVKNDKTYHNGLLIQIFETKEYSDFKENKLPINIQENKIDSTTINTLIMTTKEIYLAHLSSNNRKSLKDIATEVSEAYTTLSGR